MVSSHVVFDSKAWNILRISLFSGLDLLCFYLERSPHGGLTLWVSVATVLHTLTKLHPSLAPAEADPPLLVVAGQRVGFS